MHPNRALFSGWTVTTDEAVRSDHLKLCFLWYDEIVLETIGQYDEARFINGLLQREAVDRAVTHSMTDVIRPLNPGLQRAVAGDLYAQASRGYPRWGKEAENYTYPNPETPAEFAHNKMLELIANEHGVSRFYDGYDIQQAEGRARIAVDAVTLWEGVNTELPCMLQASGDEQAAMVAARQFTSEAAVQEATLRLFEVAVPSLRDVTWRETVAFRKSGSLKSLRHTLSSSIEQSGADIEKASALLQRSEQEMLEAMLEVSRPRLKRVAFEAILSNIPGLAVNPFSLFFGARDTAHHYKRQKDAAWFYLLRDIRAAATRAARDRIDA